MKKAIDISKHQNTFSPAAAKAAGISTARRYTLYVNDSAIPYDGFGAYQHLWAVPRQLNAGDTLYITGYHSVEDSSAVLVIAKA